MTGRSKTILWDIAFVVGVLLCLFLPSESHLYLITGLVTVMIFTNCITNHIAVYKLTGKLY